LFWAVFASYGLQWLLAKLLGRRRLRPRLARVHRANARRLARGFARLRGVFIKLGQVLSVVGTFLPKAYAEELERLQDQVPPRPFREILGRLREAFGDDALSRFESFEPTPLAAASLAQVHRARSHDGRLLAVKVLYPGIEELIRRDLAVLRSILPIVRRLITVSRIERVLDQVAVMLQKETNYAEEKANIERMRGIFAGRTDIVVPEVVEELTRGGVLTMSHESGIKIIDFESLAAAGVDNEAVARLLVDAYFTMLFDHSVFHADPHPGNFLVRPGPELVILDYGAVFDITPPLAEGMRMVVMGALARDDEQILNGLERMGFVAESGDRELLKRVGKEYLRVLADVKIEDFSRLDRRAVEQLSGYRQLRGQLRDVMRHVEYPEGFFYVERTLALLFGLVGRLAPKRGLPGLVAPHAAKAFARALAAQAAAPS
jgi:predicted unusual protein kinase regulating ubiquinone biosynthesis (AarF/ABC1/UbiB family)